MRKLAFTLMVSASVFLPGAARSQGDQPASVDDYVCTFSGDCAAQNTTQEEGDAAGPRPRLSATRGFALSRPDSPNDARPTQRRSPNPAPRRRAHNLATTPGGSSAVSPAGPGQRVNLRLSFETGSANLTATARAQAQVFARSLQTPQLRNMRFLIEGHTDSVGVRARNIDLSQRRAQTLADLLAAAGVGRDRLVVRGYGPDRPLPGLPSTAGENRRVEAVRIS